MAFRFRRSIRITRGLRLNLSKSGVSATVGRKGLTATFGPKGSAVNVGIPGTGLSYRTTSSSSSSSSPPLPASRSTSGAGPMKLITAKHRVQVDDDCEDNHEWRPEETVYRIAALLAASLLGGADPRQVEVRIAGLLPERITYKLTGATIAQSLVWMALGRDGTSYQGTNAIRRALKKNGFQDLHLVGEAVSAVRASNKARIGQAVDTSQPLEWYRDEGGQLSSREYEAPSILGRVPAESLAPFHAKQVELGVQRLASTEQAARKEPIWFQVVMGILMVPLVAALLVFLVMVGAVMFSTIKS